MPCDSVITLEADLKVANVGILKKAAEALGLQIKGNCIIMQDGTAIQFDGEKVQCERRHLDTITKLRVEYSHQCVKHVAKKLGWSRSLNGTNKLKLSKGF